MNNKPFVSIIIPFYNTPEKLFKRCINSLLVQSYRNFEAVIINDGSKKEYDYLLEYAIKQDSRIRVINKNNEGVAIARNIGIGVANGEYLMFLDADDALTEFCLEEAYETVSNTRPDLVLGGVRKVKEDEIDNVRYEKVINPRYITVDTDEKRNSLMAHMIGYTDVTFLLQKCYIGDGPVARLLRMSIAKSTLFNKDAAWDEDTIWNAELLKKCKNIIIIDDLWYKYLIYSKSATHRYRPNCQYEFEYNSTQEIQLFKKLWPDCMESVYTRLFYDLTILCRTFLFHPDNPKSSKEKYQIYKACIHTDAYREALRGMNLHREKRLINRAGKELFKFTAYYGPHRVSYWILNIFYRLRKDSM